MSPTAPQADPSAPGGRTPGPALAETLGLRLARRGRGRWRHARARTEPRFVPESVFVRTHEQQRRGWDCSGVGAAWG